VVGGGACRADVLAMNKDISLCRASQQGYRGYSRIRTWFPPLMVLGANALAGRRFLGRCTFYASYY